VTSRDIANLFFVIGLKNSSNIVAGSLVEGVLLLSVLSVPLVLFLPFLLRDSKTKKGVRKRDLNDANTSNYNMLH
jgi:hypothetical protein